MEPAGRQRKPGVALLQDAEVGKGMCSNSKYGDRTNAANWKRRETYKLLAMSVAAVGAVFAWSRVWDPDEHFGDHDENKNVSEADHRVGSLVERVLDASIAAASAGTTELAEMKRQSNAEPVDLVVRMPPHLTRTVGVVCRALCASNCSATGRRRNSCSCYGSDLNGILPALDADVRGRPDAAQWGGVLARLLVLPTQYKLGDMCAILKSCVAAASSRDSFSPETEGPVSAADPGCRRKAIEVIAALRDSHAGDDWGTEALNAMTHAPEVAAIVSEGPSNMRDFVDFHGSTTYGNLRAVVEREWILEIRMLPMVRMC